MNEKVKIWLEFEHWLPDGKPTDYFNMQITLGDGRRYALNVWVAGAVEEIVRENDDGLSGAYAIGPDLIVRSAERPLLEAVVQDLVVRGLLKEEWRSPTKGEEP